MSDNEEDYGWGEAEDFTEEDFSEEEWEAYGKLIALPNDQAASLIARWFVQTGYSLSDVESYIEEEGE